MDLRPQMETLRVFEQGGARFRIYLTVGGAIAVERWNAKTSLWSHVPLMEASEKDIADILKARYESGDEEIARTVSSYGQ